MYVGIMDFVFFDFLDLEKFLLSALPSSLTTLLTLGLSSFGAKFNHLVVFNIKISNATILLKP